ncbi:S-adenosyl-L-methionine-dependent methyltransferase [Thelephora ganbajun]|uniref:S-adenosyl-L-methionine-dependent methyltransferase n=1 Tax=Thelephora ganbajun TaxID=370292 RepID=A0ACB6ZET6_THEGA|nr:S-adenosyl-L-methionine-dependent methyltransferase [Thelephora ganbajun]
MPERTIPEPTFAAGRKMRSSKVIYPLDYNRQLQDFDNWDHMVFVRMFGRLTVYDFPTPPEGVLDLGCGTGLWCIEAAKQWPRSTFVGVDIKKLQPDLARSGHMDLASRIKWVHANFLNALPFASNIFDFVRIRYIGLAVPEDKWQDLLEEVHRVLKPGGLVEITEDDLTFPCGPAPYPSLTDSNLLATTSSSDSTTGSSQTSLTTPVSTQPRDHMNLLIPSASIGDLEALSPSSPTQCESKISPRDHRRICESWKDMLNHHFIAPPVSILPFYLSSIFAHVAPQPLLQLNLPPNSSLGGQPRPRGSPDSPIGFHVLNSADEGLRSQGSLSISYPLPESVMPLQLARQVHMIVACKDVIWERYQALYSKSSTVSDVTISKKERNIKSNTARDEFEFHWENWVNDMLDRMDIRNIVMAAFSVPPPPGNHTPEHKVWRKRCGEIEHADSDQLDDSVCRYIRTFLSWKASDPV